MNAPSLLVHLGGVALFATIGGVAVANTVVGDLKAPEAAAVTTDCGSCSEEQTGYRWAAAQRIDDMAGCSDASWGFRQGCLNYLGRSTG